MKVWLDTPRGTILVDTDDIAIVQESHDLYRFDRIQEEIYAEADQREPRVFAVVPVRTLRLKSRKDAIVIRDNDANRKALIS